MTEAAVPTLVLIAAAAALAPIIGEQTRRFRVPSVVIELALGILMGPFVLNLVRLNDVVTALSDMGLTFLMFLAGFELDLSRVRGRPLRLAFAGWLSSVALALAVAFALVSSGLALDTLIVGLSLTTTALGTLLPVLGDTGVLGTPFGAYVLGIGTVGEFGPIVLVAVLLAHKDPVLSSLLLVAFVAIATVTALLATRAHPPKVVALLRRHLHSSAQLPVRVAVLLVLLLVYLALKLGLDVLLGSFAAGIVVRLFTSGQDSEVVESKLEAIGFGFLVPIFFVVSGARFDLQVLLTRGSAVVRLFMFLLALLVVRGVPTLLWYRRALPRVQRLPLALFSATGLPLIVVITAIGTSEGRMRPENAAALVGAGMLSVLLFPMLGLRSLRAASGAARGTVEPPLDPGVPGDRELPPVEE
ncbi:MAG TPA: cation:proton antiporter [Acidimicrobiales bacterium]|jgi:Kef-type K+ transport system membrane component KefB